MTKLIYSCSSCSPWRLEFNAMFSAAVNGINILAALGSKIKIKDLNTLSEKSMTHQIMSTNKRTILKNKNFK